ncbi:hypothetical protein [Coxiella burnetii]|uniref:Uncharacterized protein n=1 Tax=Coxiella burnetii (strain Dugway 5J108-111) TaxID=434922 RepID=A9KGJ3_COXBN|nr:hypothetical protein [Coxiella burnetii]ABS76638.1 hypothetical protein CBUD_1705 [Coxiella burnetii Dugway 5J108-111]ACJ19841.1 hypothetical protein CbuK_0568 [Coxiella burnetii CbuK_Q154]AIT62863.1 hypothetical protein CBNA_0536 [Coxiella burnetii str. Namibia]ATN85546.1 hypothetical protein AYO29_03150 [Coxiella burnetii str. Schperling]EAX33358.1 hypothetical protein A35_02835 [Coxiella burnetii 'MSU Goat Q177']
MPQIDLKYSNDLKLEIPELFQSIEEAINKIDHTAGACKSRAYPSPVYLHTHFYLRIAMLKKPYRDENFMNKCLKRIEEMVKPILPEGCYYSVELVFSSEYYFTSRIEK